MCFENENIEGKYTKMLVVIKLTWYWDCRESFQFLNNFLFFIINVYDFFSNQKKSNFQRQIMGVPLKNKLAVFNSTPKAQSQGVKHIIKTAACD